MKRRASSFAKRVGACMRGKTGSARSVKTRFKECVKKAKRR